MPFSLKIVLPPSKSARARSNRDGAFDDARAGPGRVIRLREVKPVGPRAGESHKLTVTGISEVRG